MPYLKRISRRAETMPASIAAQPRTPREASASPFSEFLGRYREVLRRVFRGRADADEMATSRGMPPFVLREVLRARPLSVFIPEEHGGRGGDIREGQAVLEVSSYESLALGLMMGINGGLFLQPLGKYGDPAVQREVFPRFVEGQAMGGLMITEPDYGSDALSIRTHWSEEAGRYRVRGTKHWAGLTGWADYWLVTARERDPAGNLGRDIDLFVCAQDDPEQLIHVEERFPNLGLWAIPYGRNRLDVRLPKAHRLAPEGTGITMLLDLLHRSRMQFPGMGLGFIRRMLDEALAHARTRVVGGQPLIDYDQVRARIARLQAQFTTVSAMCIYTSEHAATARDLSKEAIPANAIKTVCTDFMQDAAQSVVQLVGAQGYRLDHVAGRGIVDSRPFQIFEGSNDILYEQISQAFMKGMRRIRESNLYRYLKQEATTARAADYFRDLLDFEIDSKLPQRKLVQLGEALSRIVSMDFTLELGARGFRPDLISNALTTLRQEVEARLASFRQSRLAELVEEYVEDSHWLSFLQPAPAPVAAKAV